MHKDTERNASRSSNIPATKACTHTHIYAYARSYIAHRTRHTKDNTDDTEKHTERHTEKSLPHRSTEEGSLSLSSFLAVTVPSSDATRRCSKREKEVCQRGETCMEHSMFRVRRGSKVTCFFFCFFSSVGNKLNRHAAYSSC